MRDRRRQQARRQPGREAQGRRQQGRRQQALCGAALALVIAGASCARVPAADATDEPHRRRPDGVSIDPPPALPVPADQATSGEGVVALRSPLGSDAALDLLHDYVRAIVAEDTAAMTALHTGNSVFVLSPPGQAAGTFPGAAGLWERRFARLDYRALGGAVVVRETEARVRKVEHGGEPVLPGGPGEEGVTLEGAELEVRAPVATARAGGQSLLGSELVLYLRREGGAWRVSAVLEDYALP